MNHKTNIIAVCLLMTIAPAVQASNLLINGGFEDPVISDNSFAKLSSIPGWSSPNDGALFEIWSGTEGSIPATEGNQSLEINASIDDETIEQTITVTPGVLTTLSFDYTGREVDNTFIVKLSGGYTYSDTLDPAIYSSADSWDSFSMTFTPTTNSLTLSFEGNPNPPIDAGAHIDNVSVTQVPEPSAELLEIIGAAGLFLRRIRKSPQRLTMR